MSFNFVWSHSAIVEFNQCPYKFYRKRVVKDVREEESEALRIGNHVHKLFEDRVNDGVAFPDEFGRYESYVRAILSWPGETVAEAQMGMTRTGKATGFFDADVWGRGKIDVLNIDGETAKICDWKGLALDTPIPTPAGWTTMRDIRTGDLVFGRDGNAYPVAGKSADKLRRCYEIQFNHGPSVVCDDEHLWVTTKKGVVPVTELAPWDGVPLPEPINTASAELPVDPYVLGLWLANGRQKRGEICKPDSFVWEEIERRGYTLGKQQGMNCGRARSHTVLGLTRGLRAVGVLGRRHIPTAYKRASYEQRLDLVRGIADGDGYANTCRKQAHVVSTNKELAHDIAEVVRSLGERAVVSVVTSRGFGKVVTAYCINWRPRVNPFLLPSKKDTADAFIGGGKRYIEVRSVKEVPMVPTACISVASPDSTFLCGAGMIVTHNTGQKVKPDDSRAQFRTNCLLVFAANPKVRLIKGTWAYLNIGKVESFSAGRTEVPAFGASVVRADNEVRHAAETGVWAKRKSGLCNGWCPVKDCPHWAPKRKGR